ncbi:MAG: transcription initiation factor IIB [Candidatus Bathyarchaeota archaeon]|jgi:transcription initiation factor TFIIB|nr:transcription initiation factor IIB [Candidatus Bathyarchaeota archaeon]
MQEMLQEQNKGCAHCKSANLITDKNSGEIVCSQCGLVTTDDMLNQTPEWKAVTLEQYKTQTRTGIPIRYSRFDKGLHTTITGYMDGLGKPLSSKAKRRAYYLRRTHNRSITHDSHEQNLKLAMNELRILSEKLHISFPVQELAAVIYRKALNKDLIRGRCIKTIAAAAMYVACRFTKTSKTLSDIARYSGLNRIEVSRDYRLIINTLKIKMPSHDPLNYISRLAEKANISGKVQGAAIRILAKAKRKRITTGKDPVGMAAAVLYIACQLKGENVTQEKIAKVAGVSEVTVRNRKRELCKKLGL